jgi:hypothetical protein
MPRAWESSGVVMQCLVSSFCPYQVDERGEEKRLPFRLLPSHIFPQIKTQQ